jgi:hypothetical protein
MFITLEKHDLQFIKPAKTSRGEYIEKPSYLLWITHENFKVCGEASPLSDLSIDGKVNFFEVLSPFEQKNLEVSDLENLLEEWKTYPTLRFALFAAIEKAKTQINQLNSNNTTINQPNRFVDNAFTRSEVGLKINGLVWMNDIDSMYEEAISKINAGFSCIKIKVGALDFDSECRLIEKIRSLYNPFKIELRLDANGGFKFDEALLQIKELSRFDIHSLEQPIQAKQPEWMSEICAKSSIDIALDEELIGVAESNIPQLLKQISPKYIILKPTLLGGFDICDTWIHNADKSNIGWWSTSALEGNIGLADIAQWVSKYKLSMPQGLGTGSLFVKNFEQSTTVKGESIFYINNTISTK